jgi:hypothetical protein
MFRASEKIKVNPIMISCTRPCNPNPTASPITEALAKYAIKETFYNGTKNPPYPSSTQPDVLKVVSKPPLRANFYVGPRDSTFQILYIFLRLNPSPRLDIEPD